MSASDDQGVVPDDNPRENVEPGPPDRGMEGQAGDSFEVESDTAERDSGIEDVPGAPTWPIASGEAEPETAAPPVGLNWGAVSERLGVDRRVLIHDGIIVVGGEYYPENGFFIDPRTMQARHVHAGDMALKSGYFLGEVTASEFGVTFPVEGRSTPSGRVVPPHDTGPIIGLFADRINAERARSKIMRNSLGADVGLEDGPLGSQLRVGNPLLPGRVATVIAGYEGAVLSIGGKSTSQ